MGRKKIDKAPQKDSEKQERVEPVAKQVEEEAEESNPKTKKIAKNQKRQNNPEQTQKKQDGPNSSIDLFPEAFVSQIEAFTNFFSDYLSLKCKNTDIDPAEELGKISNSLSEKIHAASNQVIKQDLIEAEEWVENEQAVISKHIKNVELTLEETKGSLQKNLIFTAEEVEQQLTGIRKKRETLQKSYNSFEEIKKKIESLYKNQIDEE